MSGRARGLHGGACAWRGGTAINPHGGSAHGLLGERGSASARRERRVLAAWGPRLLGAQQAGTRERGRVWARAGKLWRRKARSQGDPVHAAADGVRPSGDVSVS